MKCPMTALHRQNISVGVRQAYIERPWLRRIRSETMKRLWRDPKWRAGTLEGLRESFKRPEVHYRMSQAQRKRRSLKTMLCQPCREGQHLLCDGDDCQCSCVSTLDVLRRPEASI